MKKVTLSLLCLLFALGGTYSQAQITNWTAFENLNDSLRKERRPLLVFIHTDWCKYCKMMEIKTFANPQLAKVLNQQYYCLHLDAEDTRTLSFLNKKYKFKPSGVETGVHELAELLGNDKGKLTYPTTVFFDQNLQLQGRIVGVIDRQRLQAIVAK